MRCRSGSYLSTSQFDARTRGNIRKEIKIQSDGGAHHKVRIFTCGVNANILSCKEYSLLVLRIPTSLDLRPDNPSFLLRPNNEYIIFNLCFSKLFLNYSRFCWVVPKYVYKWLRTFAGCTSIGATSAIVCTWISCCAIFSLISMSSAKITTCTTTSGFFSLHNRLFKGSNSPTARNPWKLKQIIKKSYKTISLCNNFYIIILMNINF